MGDDEEEQREWHLCHGANIFQLQLFITEAGECECDTTAAVRESQNYPSVAADAGKINTVRRVSMSVHVHMHTCAFQGGRARLLKATSVRAEAGVCRSIRTFRETRRAELPRRSHVAGLVFFVLTSPCAIDSCFDFHKRAGGGGGCAAAALLTAACQCLCVAPLPGRDPRAGARMLCAFASRVFERRFARVRLLSEMLRGHLLGRGSSSSSCCPSKMLQTAFGRCFPSKAPLNPASLHDVNHCSSHQHHWSGAGFHP